MDGSRDDEPPDPSAPSAGSAAGTGTGQEAASGLLASAEAVGHEGGRAAVTVTDRREGGVEVDGERWRRLVSAVLAELGVPAGTQVDVTCVGVEEMAELNTAHMEGEGPTDVLAFPLDEPGSAPPGVPEILGDVVLCPEVAVGQAAEAGKDPMEECDMLLVHGLLHLLGHDHQEPEERQIMFGLTDRLLAAFAGGPS